MFPETANWLTPADEYVAYSYYNIKTNYVLDKNHTRWYQRRHLIF